MPEKISEAQRSYVMSRVKGKDTVPELLLRSALHRRGLRFRKNLRSLPGSPDVAFTRRRVAIFVDGDFWHGRNLDSMLNRGAFSERREFWESKLRRNIERDHLVSAQLSQMGWVVMRFWESDIRQDVEAIAEVIEKRIRN